MIPIATILLVDDHPSVGEGTKQRVERESDFQVTVVESGTEALQLLAQGQFFDLMLFDLNMPVINGLELTRRIMETHPDSIILIYTGFDIAPNFNILIEAGVSGFVNKATSWARLINILRCALQGETVLPTMLVKELRRTDIKVPVGSNDSLEHISINQREQAILQEIAQGKSNKEIAAMMFMSQRMIEYNLSKIFEKLNVSSRSEAITEAKKHGLIQETKFE
ncbi:two component transcriptional regulator, LuxR family [Paenibacillus curdlanolyticus YK9]|uniref:Two component transcriptional regulator, LuxR family n=1 Tax=Paenibacillus curdlanolyticus YK9 TaxID=717606 RepID=E0IG79_9BACL|nr:response regulator transcription factor [Paenibacillus curdlanolyticus]EFM08481.1 two component transcriptional regulator, LuxR family [Paenibacillus curdlanolyticus YK9]